MIEFVESGLLEIDAHGRVWRTDWNRKRRAEKSTGTGYLMVRVMRNKRRICGVAHRLIWQHRFGDIPDGLCINHKNGQKDDNRPGNLELVTYSQNMKHAFRTGLRDQHGEKNPASKLSDHQIAEIRLAFARGGITQSALAKKYSVSFQHVSKIVKGTRRSQQPGPLSKEDCRPGLLTERDKKTGRFVRKVAAGRLLDGRTWEEFPEIKP